MARVSIDFKAAQLFFNLIKQVKGVLGCQNFIAELVGKLAELGGAESASDMTIAMICRGFLLTLTYQEFSIATWHTVTVQVLQKLALLLKDRTESQKQAIDLLLAH